MSSLVVAFRVFCCHSFNCRCFADISAISEQCGVFRLVVATVLPMVDSAADFSTCSTDVHLSLAVVFVLTSEMESDTAARNIARFGSFTSKFVLYRTCLGIRANTYIKKIQYIIYNYYDSAIYQVSDIYDDSCLFEQGISPPFCLRHVYRPLIGT